MIDEMRRSAFKEAMIARCLALTSSTALTGPLRLSGPFSEVFRADPYAIP